MRAFLILLLSASLLQGCGTVRGWFGGSGGQQGLPYRAKLQKGEDRRDFTVTVDARGAPLNRARESARYEATRYCLRRFGNSNIDWVMDASGTDWASARTTDGDLIVRGRCSARF